MSDIIKFMNILDEIDFENMTHEEYFQSAIRGLRHAADYSSSSDAGKVSLLISLLYSVMSIYKYLVEEKE